jgi:hypothetical protein
MSGQRTNLLEWAFSRIQTVVTVTMPGWLPFRPTRAIVQ